MIHVCNSQREVIFCDDIMDAAHYLRSQPRRWKQASSIDDNVTFRGASYDQALAYAIDGWQEGAAKVENAMRLISPPTTTHNVLRFDVAGYFPDVPRYLSGDPANMIRRGKADGHKPVLHIVANGAMMTEATATQVLNFGIAVAAVIEVLEAGQHRVELDVVAAAGWGGPKVITGWKVKHARDPLDLATVAFSLAHIAAHRRLRFALRERAYTELSAYGESKTVTQADLADFNASGALIINGVGHEYDAYSTVTSARRMVAENINEAAGETLVELPK